MTCTDDLLATISSGAGSTNQINRNGLARGFLADVDVWVCAIAWNSGPALPDLGSGPFRAGLADRITTTSGHTLSTTPWLDDLSSGPAYVDIAYGDVVLSDWNVCEFGSYVHLEPATPYSIVIQNQNGDSSGERSLRCRVSNATTWPDPFTSDGNNVGTGPTLSPGSVNWTISVSLDPWWRIYGVTTEPFGWQVGSVAL